MRAPAIALIVALGLTPAALAAGVSDGIYKQGPQDVLDDPGVRIKVKNGRLEVLRITITERCVEPGQSLSQPVYFIKAPGARMEGKIARDGRFSVSNVNGDTTWEVRGRFNGGIEKVVGIEHADFKGESGKRVVCHGRHTFNRVRNSAAAR